MQYILSDETYRNQTGICLGLSVSAGTFLVHGKFFDVIFNHKPYNTIRK